MLESIGFYTLSDYRAKRASTTSPLWRCELLLTNRCNFNCPYCRHIGASQDLSFDKAKRVVDYWCSHSLQNIRFSGGEPTLWEPLTELVSYCRNKLSRVAISTNGSASWHTYQKLINAGVDDFSVSLDACCAADFGIMSGKSPELWDRVSENIRRLSAEVYTTVGMVFNNQNVESLPVDIGYASGLGVDDIRIVPAQYNRLLNVSLLPKGLIDYHPILAYRVKNILNKRNVRGIRPSDNNRCPLVLDDMAVADNYHYPCIIYLREGGKPIGNLDSDVRAQRYAWAKHHNTHNDLICRKMCLDVCVDYNNRWRDFHGS